MDVQSLFMNKEATRPRLLVFDVKAQAEKLNFQPQAQVPKNPQNLGLWYISSHIFPNLGATR